MEKIYAGIITFNPDRKLLYQNIESIINQVSEIVIVDNGSNNVETILEVISEFSAKITLLKNDRNYGIAKALNRAMSYGDKHDYEWMLSLDQDSKCPDMYVSRMRKYLNIENNIGVAAPIIRDRKVGIVGHNPTKAYSEVRTCITSGAFSRISVWKMFGGYDEKMFIDYVDFEYCYQVRRVGYKVIQTSEVELEHSLGEGKFVRFLGIKFRDTQHNAFRCFYIAQNDIYYPKKHHLLLQFVRGNIRNFVFLMRVIMYEDDKKDKCSAILKGWLSGYKMSIK